MFGLQNHHKNNQYPKLVFAPIIDSNEPHYRYRLAARLGTIFPRIFTVPGELHRQAVGSDLVICRSEYEKLRVIRGLGVQPAKVRVVYNGVNPPAPVETAPVLARLNLPNEFVLHVSVYTSTRKNVMRLLEAIGPTGIPLVIAGTARQEPILKHIQEISRKFTNIRLLGFLPLEDLSALYGTCKVFCLPSIHEGTGLAALEAAAHGAAVVITQNGGTRDYFSDLAYYVNPVDVTDIRTAVLAAWAAPRTDALRRYVLTNLTWEQSARGLITAYQEIL